MLTSFDSPYRRKCSSGIVKELSHGAGNSAFCVNLMMQLIYMSGQSDVLEHIVEGRVGWNLEACGQ